MTILYLVTARRGCYSDAQAWNVRAFPNREGAEAWAGACRVRVREIEALDEDTRYDLQWPDTGYLTEDQAAFLGQFDQCLVYRSETTEGRPTVGIWAGGEAPEYAIEEVPFGLP